MNRWKELICVLFGHRWEKKKISLMDGFFISQVLTRQICKRCGLETLTIETQKNALWEQLQSRFLPRKSQAMDQVDAILYGADFSARIPDRGTQNAKNNLE
jgi:hypothetical protein